jgi:hypothetical protein
MSSCSARLREVATAHYGASGMIEMRSQESVTDFWLKVGPGRRTTCIGA